MLSWGNYFSMRFFSTILLASIAFGSLLFSCGQSGQEHDLDEYRATTIQLDSVLASRIFHMPVHCIEIEYPNKLGQALGSDADLKPPRELRPVFYGCYDWHSAVHGYWSIVQLLRQFPELDSDSTVRNTIDAHITPNNIAREQAFFLDKNNLAFERTYGWAWLFKLQEALLTWDDEDARRWASNLQPLVDLLEQRLTDYLPKLVYPVRHGKHENLAFGLSLMWDYGQVADRSDLLAAIKQHSIRLYGDDIACDLSYEPSGSDFLSPCLEEAHLMSKLLSATDYASWLRTFMPTLFDADFALEPARVLDRSDGQLVHLDGLNYSRAASLYGIANALPKELQHLRFVADDHIRFSLPNLAKEDDYMGSHWLGTFALYALSNQ